MALISPKESPFSPGKPVQAEYFVARSSEIQSLERRIRQASSGRNENIFITGERGIGKSSLAGFIRYLAEREYNFLGTHCFLGGVRDLEGMTRMIFQRLLQEVTDKTLFDRLKSLFGKYIKELTLFGVGIEFTRDKNELRGLLENFVPVMRKVHETIRDTKKGSILILDDLNGISDLPALSQFLKSFVDELATSRNSIPLVLILVGIPDRRNDLIRHQPSVARVFDVIDLPPMTTDECEEFFRSMFRQQNIMIDAGAISTMVTFSAGLPVLMHEIGDAVFWEDADDRVDQEDAIVGTIVAAENVGRKYLDPHVYRALRSETYRSILRTIGKQPLATTFQRKRVLAQLPETDRKGFDNFLRRITKLGVVRRTEVPGEYTFVNQLYHLYVRMEAFRAERDRTVSAKR